MKILLGVLFACFAVHVCNAQGDSSELSECIGYISGVVDAGTIASQRNENGKFPVCIPETVSKGQLVRVYLKYADNHPERLHLVAATLVVEALATAFPCAVVK